MEEMGLPVMFINSRTDVSLQPLTTPVQILHYIITVHVLTM